eukprot:800079-Lingulodinium_polyedra.AAC.1
MVPRTASAALRMRLRVSRRCARAALAMALRAFLARRLACAGPQDSPANAAVAAAALMTVEGQGGAPLMPHSTVMAPSM